MNHKVLFLSLEDVVKCGATDMNFVTERIRLGFDLFEGGDILNPTKTSLRASKIDASQESSGGVVNFLPAYVQTKQGEIYSCKSIASMPSNNAKGFPRATGLISLFDPTTKFPMVIMDAQVISAMRTGAVSKIAAEKLLPNHIDSAFLVGAGVNMRTQLYGISQSVKIDNVYVYSRGESKYLFAKEMSEKLNLNIIPVENLEPHITNSKLVVTCVANTNTPVVKEKYINFDGVTIFNIGTYECETSILPHMDKIISDMWESSKHRGVQTHAIAYKQGIITDEQVENLGPIVVGEKPGRQNESENIFFCPTGLGFEDALVAQSIYQTAIEKGIGQYIKLWDNYKRI